MQFLEPNDFKGVIGTNTLTQQRGTNDENLLSAESLAISELDPLRTKYAIAAELAKTGTSRNGLLIRFMIHITAYYLFNTVDDTDIPERITENYNNQIQTINKIASGSMDCTLDPVYTEEGTAVTSFRFGGDAPRDNDIF